MDSAEQTTWMGNKPPTPNIPTMLCDNDSVATESAYETNSDSSDHSVAHRIQPTLQIIARPRPIYATNMSTETTVTSQKCNETTPTSNICNKPTAHWKYIDTPQATVFFC